MSSQTEWYAIEVDRDEQMRTTEYLICRKPPEPGKASYRSITWKEDFVDESDFIFAVRGVLRSLLK